MLLKSKITRPFNLIAADVTTATSDTSASQKLTAVSPETTDNPTETTMAVTGVTGKDIGNTTL